MHRNTRTAAVLFGLALSIATSQAWPQMVGEASLVDVQLDSAQPAVALQLLISTQGEVKAADVTQLDITVLGDNAAPQSAVLSLYVLEEAWTGAPPEGAEPADQMNLRGAVGDQPADIHQTLYATLDGAPTQHIVLVLDGDAEVQVDLELRAVASFADELPSGSIELEVVR